MDDSRKPETEERDPSTVPELQVVQSPASSKLPPTVLIVTSVDAELAALQERLKGLQGYPNNVGSIPVEIGELGSRVVAVCKTMQDSADSSRDVVGSLLDSVELKTTKLVLGLGTALGTMKEQRIGDVLVASCILASHPPKGDSAPVMRRPLLSSFADAVSPLLTFKWPSKSQSHVGNEMIPENRRPRVYHGAILSLPTPLDHDQIVPHKPVGAGAALYEIADEAVRARTPWLVATAIRGFVIGPTEEQEDKESSLAPAAAADFATWLLSRDIMDHYLK